MVGLSTRLSEKIIFGKLMRPRNLNQIQKKLNKMVTRTETIIIYYE